MKKKIIILHNFPTPYRNFLFEKLYSEALKRNIHLEIYFFSKFDKSRPTWNFRSDQLKYPHKFWNLIFKLGSVLHFNPSMLINIYINKPDLIIMGGLWASINTILLTLFSSIPLIVWDETNRFDFGSAKKRFNILKKYLVLQIKYFAVPGLESILFYKELLAKKDFLSKSFLSLPNLIDENSFNRKEISEFELAAIKKKYSIPLDKKIVYWPARFIQHKGIINFINYLDDEILKSWLIIIVGHGPLLKQCKAKIVSKNLQNYFMIINTLPYDEAKLFYFIADLFIMPSISDSNPLSVIEAIHSSLPILISNRVGNLNEVLDESVNGFCVDPFDKNSMEKGIKEAFRKTKDELKEMGKFSKIIANKNFDSKRKVEFFFDDIIDKFKII